MREEKVGIPLDDEIWGIEGSYAGKEEATGYDAEEPLFYIKYVPIQDPNKSLAEYTKMQFGQHTVCRTPEPVPDSAFERVVCAEAGAIPGVPQEKLVLRYDRHGDARWAERKGKRAEQELKQAKEKVQSKESRSLTEKAKAMRLQQEKELADDTEARRMRRRRPGLMEETEGRDEYE